MSTPRDTFQLLDSSEKVLLFAHDIGLTPLLAIARELSFRQRAFDLHYFVPSFGAVTHRVELSDLERNGHVHYHGGLDPPAIDRLVGYVVEAIPASTQIYCCGPTDFNHVIATHARQWVYGFNIHLESVSPAPE
ncbi:ferredoxin reductase domain-containing protein [Paraburkholderia haematera]|jgi:Flavodoxin reductases (ferredoxin-NADPH reductases) family 1|uniref:Carnitine monooxygenase reductase subunit n=1 Tax=Paraburkholderia haematera TaxID=2793077 RepID=A0ABM8RPJ7_9BURK|nr:hypothetical protein [Paraburkholderia haematera]CAE6764299.1 Carnitine monooxygenase reductase subunit [Paraburkholderia haematera]